LTIGILLEQSQSMNQQNTNIYGIRYVLDRPKGLLAHLLRPNTI